MRRAMTRDNDRPKLLALICGIILIIININSFEKLYQLTFCAAVHLLF